MCAMMLNDVPTMMELDPGSDVTLISSRQFEQIQQGSRKLQLTTESSQSLRNYSGKTIQPVGRVTDDVYHQEKSYQLFSNLLGGDWFEHLKLDWSTVHHMDSVDYANMFPELFSEGLGPLKGVGATMYVDDKMIPRCFKPRPVPLALRGKVQTEVNRLQAQRMVKVVEHSDWTAPIVPVLKTKREVRICSDYKLTVNVAAKVDKYPIPKQL